jgi:RNA polymerase sigma factor (sigma-70 family)
MATGDDSSDEKLLFKRHSAKVYGFLVKQLKTSSEADDVLQSTFLKLHNSRGHFDPAFPFAPWLFTICKSVMLDHIRKQKRILEVADSETVDHFAKELRESPSLSLIPLEQLSVRDRTVLEMRYQEDLPFEEIARRLEISQDNARRIVSRGINRLKTFIKKKGNKGNE